ncbi:MAG: phosphoglycerate mutase family protein [Calditrichaeota bacterium]|nr:phosphoglycerate mutase family protein [Calditrichota bacterium]
MRIVLLRHGRPDVHYPEKMKANEMRKIIDAYNAAGLSEKETPPENAVAAAKTCKIVVCSDLQRSLDSARALGLNPGLVDPLFRELDLPYPNSPFFSLSPFVWSILFRVIWFFGYSANSESYREARKRAASAAQKLIEIAKENESAILIGHGFLNRFISKEFLSRGWQGPRYSGKNFWSLGVYEFSA